MKKLNQKGIGVVEVLLLLVLVGLIAAVGYYVYNSQKKTNESLDNASQSLTDAAKASQEAKEENKESSYLVIKELGIKIELTSGIEDAYYVMKDGIAYLSTISLNAADPECGADGTSVVAVTKAKKTDQGAPGGAGAMPGETYEDAAKKPGSDIVIIGNDAYFLTRSQSYCSEDVKIQAKQQAAWNAFLAQAKTIQAL